MLTLACTAAHADWVLPSGASAQLGGGQASMGCTNVQHSGVLTLDGGALQAARDVQIAAGAQLNIDSGRVELAQLWANQGSATATTGGVTRVASPGCPVVGQAGPIPLQAPPIASTPVLLPPGSVGGWAQVAISAAGAGGATPLPPGCSVTSLAIGDAATAPPNAPANTQFPLGVLRFTAQGCTNTVLSVSITYPAGSLTGMTVQKYGPHGTVPMQTGWFTPPNLAITRNAAGDTVRYTVADNGEGDNDLAPGTITDPLAPMLLAAPPGPGSTHAIPTLGEWGLLLMSALLGLLGLRRLKAPPPQRRRPLDF